MAGLDRMSSVSAGGVSIDHPAVQPRPDARRRRAGGAGGDQRGGTLLPADLPAPPVYAKVNPADAPVLTLALTSDTMPLTDVQNLVNTRLAQKISQVAGRRPGLARRRPAAGGAHPGQHPGAGRLRHRPGRRCAPRSPRPTPTAPRAASTGRRAPTRSTPTTSWSTRRRLQEPDRRLQERRAGAPDRRRAGRRRRREHAARRLGAATKHARRIIAQRPAPAGRQRHRHGRRDQERSCPS